MQLQQFREGDWLPVRVWRRSRYDEALVEEPTGRRAWVSASDELDGQVVRTAFIARHEDYLRLLLTAKGWLDDAHVPFDNTSHALPLEVNVRGQRSSRATWRYKGHAEGGSFSVWFVSPQRSGSLRGYAIRHAVRDGAYHSCPRSHDLEIHVDGLVEAFNPWGEIRGLAAAMPATLKWLDATRAV